MPRIGGCCDVYDEQYGREWLYYSDFCLEGDWFFVLAVQDQEYCLPAVEVRYDTDEGFWEGVVCQDVDGPQWVTQLKGASMSFAISVGLMAWIVCLLGIHAHYCTLVRFIMRVSIEDP